MFSYGNIMIQDIDIRFYDNSQYVRHCKDSSLISFDHTIIEKNY